jgi:hypothetical protein
MAGSVGHRRRWTLQPSEPHSWRVYQDAPQRRKAKAVPPLVNEMPAQVLTCRCGRKWANEVALDGHIWKEHDGIEPSEQEVEV